jgi:hypothetical protein
VQYFVSVGWDVATLIHASNLPDRILERVRDPHEFQGARYEIATAAIFARLDCEIRFLDEDEELRGQKHIEFIATHRPSGQQISVETKSRRREGVLHEEGEQREDDPLKGDPRAVRRRFMEALDQAPEELPLEQAWTDPSRSHERRFCSHSPDRTDHEHARQQGFL